MLRRPTASLLAAAIIVVSGVLASPVACNAVCALAQAEQMDCCKGPDLGLSTPRCCEGPQQVSRSATPATAQRMASDSLAQASFVALGVLPPQQTPRTFSRGQLPLSAAPPGGGTLVAQHTQLLR